MQSFKNLPATIATAQQLIEKIEKKCEYNDALTRAIQSFQDEFNLREISKPVDSLANINFSTNLIDKSMKLMKQIRSLAEDLRIILSLIE